MSQDFVRFWKEKATGGRNIIDCCGYISSLCFLFMRYCTSNSYKLDDKRQKKKPGSLSLHRQDLNIRVRSGHILLHASLHVTFIHGSRSLSAKCGERELSLVKCVFFAACGLSYLSPIFVFSERYPRISISNDITRRERNNMRYCA
jgi:hypothetical protein